MRRRLSIAAVLAAAGLAVTAAPASASTGAATLTSTGQLAQERAATAPASPYLYSISNRTCLSNGLRFAAKQKEVGRSGTQRFRQLAQLQHLVGARWVPDTPVASVLSTRFPNDSRTFVFTRLWTGTYGSADRGHQVRITWQGQWLNGAGAVIAKSPVVVGVRCQA